jgi:site-specific DNA-methyltransferase (adenine-specific)
MTHKLSLDTVHNQDCLAGLRSIADGTVDLAFADPPFNIGYEYDVYEDQRGRDEYLAWSRQWTGEVIRTLKPDGTFWLAIGDEYAAELKVMLQQEHKLTCRSWVVWYYTFGVNCKQKFSRSHAHLFHMVKDPKRFTFNLDPIKVPSARQLVYADRRANPTGRLPDDTWILRPQDLPAGFQADENTWYFPRVCGTFKERAGWHGCQMPEQLLGRIIRGCSNAGELVLDPFAGSGTTLAVAKKLARRFVGFELSEKYAEQIRKRLDEIEPGEPLNGAAEPLASAPSTADGRRLDASTGGRRLRFRYKTAATQRMLPRVQEE